GVCGLASSALSRQMDCLFQTPVSSRATCASLSGSVHPSGGDLQSSTGVARRWPGQVPLAPLRSQQRATPDDAERSRISAPLSLARAATGACPHPPLWLPGSPSARHAVTALLSIVPTDTRHSSRNWIRRKSQPQTTPTMDMSGLWRVDIH